MQNLLESQNLDGFFPLHFCSETTLDKFFCSPSPDKKAMSRNRSTKYSSSYGADSQDHCCSHDGLSESRICGTCFDQSALVNLPLHYVKTCRCTFVVFEHKTFRLAQCVRYRQDPQSRSICVPTRSGS